MIRFSCPACQKSLKAPVEAAGRAARCTKCNTRLHVPAPGAGPDAELVGWADDRTRELGDWTVVEGDAAHTVAIRGGRQPGRAVCALLTHRSGVLPADPLRVRVRLECKSCRARFDSDGVVVRGSGYVLGQCPHCRTSNVGLIRGDDVPAGSVVMYFDTTRLAVRDVAVDPTVPLPCVMCGTDVPRQPPPPPAGLCTNCNSESRAGVDLVGRGRFLCDACNRERPCKLGEVFKPPQISGSVFCKDCYPRAHGKSWRRE